MEVIVSDKIESNMLAAQAMKLLKNLPLSANSENLPNTEFNGNNSGATLKAKRKNQTRRQKTPQAVAVERRNARERNRVKQVNNGFAALRQHIPEEIAEIFEQQGSANAKSAAAAKKLSKVETLRMAVEYIRHLESMLTSDSSGGLDLETSSSESYLPATPPPETSPPQSQTCFYAIKPRPTMYNSNNTNTTNSEDMPKYTETQIAIINGQQYIRIPGTNTFQLLMQDLVENEENVKPDFSVLPAGSVLSRSEVVKSEESPTPAALSNITNSFIAITPSLLQMAHQIKSEEIVNESSSVISHLDFDTEMKDTSSFTDESNIDDSNVLYEQSAFAVDCTSQNNWYKIVES